MECNIIPEQFTVKAHPALLEGEGGEGGKGGEGSQKGGTVIPVYIHIQNYTKQTKTHCENTYQSGKKTNHTIW